MAFFQLRQNGNDVVGAVGADPQMPARQVAAAGEQRMRFFARGEQARRDRKQGLSRPVSSARHGRGG